MAPAVQSMVSAAYVRNAEASRAFYELLGFAEQLSGKADTAAWSLLRHGELAVLLVSTRPPLEVPQLPLLFYFYVDDVGAVTAALAAAGAAPVHTGHPPHAPGGEVKVTDPDGNTVLLGQRERPAAQPPPAEPESRHFSLLEEAAALVAAHGGTAYDCQVTSLDGTACPKRADVKLADSTGHTVWACLAHADEILITVPGAFLASQGESGIAEFLSRRS